MESDPNPFPEMKIFELPGWIRAIGRILTCRAFLPQEPLATHGHHPFDHALYDQPDKPPESLWD